jgi:predicted MFS family arabinose efflux permease
MGVPTPPQNSSPLSAATAAPFPYTGLITLAAAIFLSVTIEMLPTGLLPEMSASLGVSESLVGVLVSVFAFTVVLSSTVLTAATRRVSRHTLVVVVLIIFSISALSTSLAPTYELVVASRILGGLAHGLFWSVVGAYTAYLVPPEHIGRAVSITLGGGSLAFVLGVPTGTALGHAVGWRASFAILAGLTLVGAFLVWKLLPKVAHGAGAGAGGDRPGARGSGARRGDADSRRAGDARVGTATGGIEVLTGDYLGSAVPRREHSILGVVFVCIITALTMIGQYAFYTYIAPYLTGEVGIAGSEVSPALFAYGVMGALALVLVAVWLGRRPRASLMGCMIAILVGVVLLAAVPHVTPVAVFAYLLWAVGMGALPSLLQTRMLHATSARIRDAASAFYTTAFNTGIGGGALVGAIALGTLGLRSLPWIFAGILVVSMGLVLLADAILRKRVQRRVVAR